MLYFVIFFLDLPRENAHQSTLKNQDDFLYILKSLILKTCLELELVFSMELGHSSAHKQPCFQIRPSTFVILVEAFDAFEELNAASVSEKALFNC